MKIQLRETKAYSLVAIREDGTEVPLAENLRLTEKMCGLMHLENAEGSGAVVYADKGQQRTIGDFLEVFLPPAADKDVVVVLSTPDLRKSIRAEPGMGDEPCTP